MKTPRMPWPDERNFSEVNDLFTRLLGLWEKDDPLACRGQPDSTSSLQSSLDRILDPKADYSERLAEEEAIIEKFRVLARQYLGEAEKQYLVGTHENDRIGALTVMQHYRAPTRLLDWTASPWVALYFAAIHHHDKDGALWWFKRKAFCDEVGQRWENYGLRRHPEQNNGIDLNDTAFNTDGPPWITELNCLVPFHRIEVQQGFFTVAGRLGLDHGDLIADVMSQAAGQFSRIAVRASWKQEILQRLRNMNIHAKSLDYPGADIVGNDLTQDLKRALRSATSQDQ